MSKPKSVFIAAALSFALCSGLCAGGLQRQHSLPLQNSRYEKTKRRRSRHEVRGW